MNDGTPEAVLSLISVIVDPFELLEIVLDAGVEIALQIRDQGNRIQRHSRFPDSARNSKSMADLVRCWVRSAK